MGVSKFIVLIVAALVQPSYSAPPANTCHCTREYSPVCASDGVTYNNDCQFQCEKTHNQNLQIKSYGECYDKVDSAEAEICACTQMYAPVCGSNDQTYSNACTLKCAKKTNKNLVVKYHGECHEVNILPEPFEEICACPFNFAPICGSNDQTYSNACLLNCAKKTNKNLVVKHQGKC